MVARLHELGAVGGLEGGGCARLALTDDDKAGRDLVVLWMRDLGLDVTIDAVGNVVGVRAGRDDLAPVMTGSHIDTVRTGGLYDGNLGVLAGLEVVETLAGAGVTTRRPLAVAFFTDEEGARFPPDMLGSLVYAGGMTAEEAHDVVGIDGARLGDELARIGYLGAAPCPGAPPARLRRAAHRAGAGPRGRRHHHRRRHRCAGHLLAGGRRHRPVEPRRHHADGDAARRRAGRRRDRDLRAPPRRRARTAPGGHRGPARAVPQPGQRRRRPPPR